MANNTDTSLWTHAWGASSFRFCTKSHESLLCILRNWRVTKTFHYKGPIVTGKQSTPILSVLYTRCAGHLAGKKFMDWTEFANIYICTVEYADEWAQSSLFSGKISIIFYSIFSVVSLRWSYLQSRNRDTDVENRCMDTKGERGRVGWIGRLGLTHIHYWFYV